MEVVLLVGLVSTVAAGLACAAEHGYAARHAWGFLWRYGAGVLTWLTAIVPVFIAAVNQELTTLPVAGLLYGMMVLIIAGMAISTLACYQPPLAMLDEEEDALAAKINKALRK